MYAQSAALLPDEGSPALRVSSGCDPRQLFGVPGSMSVLSLEIATGRTTRLIRKEGMPYSAPLC